MRPLFWLVLLTSCNTMRIDFEKLGDGGALEDGGGWRCSSSTPCASPLVCDGAPGACVECRADTDCGAPTPACDTLTSRCVPCGASLGCSAPQSCVLATEACAKACSEDSQCPGSRHGCVRTVCSVCEGDNDCTGRHCDFTIGACVACVLDTHCGGGQPRCEHSTGTCVRCLVNADCDGEDACLRGVCVASH